MTYVVPTAKSALPENRFEFEIDGGTYSVPKPEFSNGAVLDTYRRMQDVNEKSVSVADSLLIYEVFAAASPKVREVIFQLEPEQVLGLFEAWQESAEADAGKSHGSEDSSTEPTSA